MQAACAKDPSGQECQALTQKRDAALLEYRMLLNEAPAECRITLPNPDMY